MKQQIIILCGPDMTGKTQIARELSYRLGVPYFKASNEHETYLNRTDNFIRHLQYADPRVLDLLKQTEHSVVFDRAYPCEWVYSRIFKRETDLNMIERIDEGFASLNAWIIVCHRSSYKGIVDDIDSKIDEVKLQLIDNEYKNFLRITRCKHMVLNVDDENLDREVNDVMFAMGFGKYKKR